MVPGGIGGGPTSAVICAGLFFTSCSGLSVWMLRYFLSCNTEDLSDPYLSISSRKQQFIHF